VFTDGALRRLIEKSGSRVALRALTAREVMHPHPRTVRVAALAVEAADMMESSRITSLLVVDEAGALAGALNSKDLMRAKVILPPAPPAASPRGGGAGGPAKPVPRRPGLALLHSVLFFSPVSIAPCLLICHRCVPR
jgi:CBS domain containing-hemolysin-like protein